MSEFLGRYEHSLDGKGRVILPARLRSSFETRAFVSKHNERCLALWTPDAFATKLAEMAALMDGPSPEGRARARAWSSGSAEVELDRQGRLALPPDQRRFAGLSEGDGVLIIGAISHVEIWNPAMWEAQEMAGDASLAGGPDPEGPGPSAELPSSQDNET